MRGVTPGSRKLLNNMLNMPTSQFIFLRAGTPLEDHVWLWRVAEAS
jgi:hypothetical protein